MGDGNRGGYADGMMGMGMGMGKLRMLVVQEICVPLLYLAVCSCALAVLSLYPCRQAAPIYGQEGSRSGSTLVCLCLLVCSVVSRMLTYAHIPWLVLY